MNTVTMGVFSTEERAVEHIKSSDNWASRGWLVVYPDLLDNPWEKMPPEGMNAEGTHRKLTIWSLDGERLERQPIDADLEGETCDTMTSLAKRWLNSGIRLLKLYLSSLRRRVLE